MKRNPHKRAGEGKPRPRGGYDLQLLRRRFDNGLTLLVSENHTIPVVTVNAYVLAGADQNPPGKSGLAELVSRLLDEGSERRGGRQMSALIENEGGHLSVFSRRELTGLSFQAGRQGLATGLKIVQELLSEPVFPEESFAEEKERLLGDLESLQDEPHSVAGRLFNAALYRGTPLEHPWLGEPAEVRGLDVQDARRFHRLKYGPANTIIAVAGDVRSREVEQTVAQGLGEWRNPRLERSAIRVPDRQRAPQWRQQAMDAEQLQILTGHLGVSRLNPDFHRLQVLDIILGSGPGFTSRIPRVLRDELGLAYLTYANITASAGLYPGRFLAYLSTSPGNRGEALARLRHEISEVAAGRFSDQELETARDFLTGNFVFGFESNENVARFLLSTELFGLGIDYPDRYPRIIESVTREDVARVAGRYLDPVNCTTVVVGPSQGLARK